MDLMAKGDREAVCMNVLNALEDISVAFMWLSSNDARFVTGIALPVDGGATAI